MPLRQQALSPSLGSGRGIGRSFAASGPVPQRSMAAESFDPDSMRLVAHPRVAPALGLGGLRGTGATGATGAKLLASRPNEKTRLWQYPFPNHCPF